ncbi:hypothetical protein JCM18899A_31060 [Nocardioides sp. AN3]
MTTSYTAETGDQPLIHQFIRLFGHRPTPYELERYERARARLSGHLPARIRRNAARLITRT